MFFYLEAFLKEEYLCVNTQLAVPLVEKVHGRLGRSESSARSAGTEGISARTHDAKAKETGEETDSMDRGRNGWIYLAATITSAW